MTLKMIHNEPQIVLKNICGVPEEPKRTKMGSSVFWHPVKRQLLSEHGLIRHSPSGAYTVASPIERRRSIIF